MAAAENPSVGTAFTQPNAKHENGEDLANNDVYKESENAPPPVKVKPLKEKKIGHRRVDGTGQTTYKKTPSSALSGSIQRGISHTVAGLSSKPERDILMQDFQVVETISFPSEGSSMTPAHHFGDFTFKTYAPIAFRYFRDLFGIRPDDYMLSISEPLTELSNPGASGSLFFVTHDDEFIIKTVQHKEAEFLQKLLPGYYMNLVQNPRTLLPKFYGLYCIQAGGKNIRIVVMNNLLPSKIKMHLKYDLKGSTYKRKASKQERGKKNPTYKDLDLINDVPDGFKLEPEIHLALTKTMQRDCLVLQSFKIMDYSMLLAIHNIDQMEKEKEAANSVSQETKGKVKIQTHSRNSSTDYNSDDTGGPSTVAANTGAKENFTVRNAVISSTMLRNKYSSDLELWSGGIPATNGKGERLLLFCGIIDILQCYKLRKKMEHTFKSMIADGDTVSVHRPGFYCERFQKFMSDRVFRKNASAVVRTQPSNRLRGHTTRRPNSSSQVPSSTGGGAGSSSTLPASTTSSGMMRLQGRPDILPNESPRPSSVTDDETDLPKYKQTTDSQKPLKLPARTASTLSKETTFNANSGQSYTTIIPSQESVEPPPSPVQQKIINVSEILQKEQVELSLKDATDEHERHLAGNSQSIQLRPTSTQEGANHSDKEENTAF
ncbi:unnamed protein product [Clavelina lepadiformis]|uniref:PIPK domain-containing protein n=1 Tax=Clavelina lepadiformis TaxID=159417 RepID=A0ABP0G2F6_CLALP